MGHMRLDMYLGFVSCLNFEWASKKCANGFGDLNIMKRNGPPGKKKLHPAVSNIKPDAVIDADAIIDNQMTKKPKAHEIKELEKLKTRLEYKFCPATCTCSC